MRSSVCGPLSVCADPMWSCQSHSVRTVFALTVATGGHDPHRLAGVCYCHGRVAHVIFYYDASVLSHNAAVFHATVGIRVAAFGMRLAKMMGLRCFGGFLRMQTEKSWLLYVDGHMPLPSHNGASAHEPEDVQVHGKSLRKLSTTHCL